MPPTPFAFRGRFILVILGLVSLMGCASPEFAKDRDAVFSQAVEASLEDDHALSAAAAWHYLQGSSPDDPRYDRALRLLARSSQAMELSYAASLWYLEIARARRAPTLVDEAIAEIESISSLHPFDEETLFKGFVSSADITGLSQEQLAFIAYYQGLDSLRRGFVDWAETQFDQIPEDNPYSLRALYVMIVRDIAKGDISRAQEDLEALKEEELPEDLSLDVDRTLARIAFEQARWDDALDAYQEVRSSAPEDPQLLLEMAWTHYYLGQYQRALGLMLALDAPAYSGLIAPERYLLEALSLRKLCQFEPARRAAVRLRQRHGEAIDDLYSGVPLDQSESLLKAARLRESGMKVADFRARMLYEEARVDKLSKKLGPQLTKGYKAIYAQGLREAKRREAAELRDEMIAVAEELLYTEEGVRLILHELGVALLRGRKRGDGAAATEAVASIDEKEEIAYSFNQEFWTDELDDIVVRIEDRCID